MDGREQHEFVAPQQPRRGQPAARPGHRVALLQSTVGVKLVEVVTTASTSDETIEDGLALCEKLGRVTVRVKDTPGFIANRLLVPFIFDSIRLLRRGSGQR